MLAILEKIINQPEIIKYWHLIIFFIPLGVIGVWRWSVWLIKKIISFFYRSPVRHVIGGTLAIITPVYNEDPEVFKLALRSWLTNGRPDEIIAVIDYTDEVCIAAFKEFVQKHKGNAKLIVTKKPGKRPALADGVKMAESEFVALVDSDTIWAHPIRDMILSPFEDDQVGGVGTRQSVLETKTLAEKLFQMQLDNRYFNEMPFLAAAGDALTCISGRTAVYRKSAIINLVDEMVNEKFWGQQSISGEDKTLTRLVQKDGWKVKYIREAVVYTPAFTKLLPYMKQLIRWSRNSWRSDLKTLTDGWVWKRNKILALHMLDRFIQPFTLLLGPVYFAVSLYFGYWKIALILLVWWMVSRAVKILPHLRRYPLDIFIMPAYVAFTYVIGMIKIYSLLTISQQGWITRWDPSRMSKPRLLKQAAVYAAAFVLIGGYFTAVGAYHYQVLEASALKIANKSTKAVASIISLEPKLVADSQLVLAKTGILTNKKNAQFGYYVVKAGDTLYSLKNRYNLTNASVITRADSVPVGNINFLSVGDKLMIPVKELQNSLNADTLLANQYLHKAPVITYDKISNTIFVRGGGSIVTLSRINQALALGVRNSLLQQVAPGEWILRANLYIGKDVTLVLDKRDVTYLKLKSDASGYVWLRSQSGNILISNTKVTSWDETRGTPDLDDQGGRSYIVAKVSGRMDVVNSEIGYLGYVGLPKRGGPFGGSYGLSWKITSGRLNNDLLTGSVINSSVHDNFFGMYTFGATGVVIKGNEVFDNIYYGIDPHDDSNNLLITENRVHNNGTHGIIISKRCINNEISNNISYDNKLHGIMLDKNSNYNIVTGNTVYGNTDGIVLDTSSNNNLISQNNAHDNKQGIRLNTGASSNYIEQNQIFSNATGSHIYAGANSNMLIGNNIYGNALGLSLKDVSGNVLYGNIQTGENKKDGYVAVNANANEIK